jgi:hypothetical protein
LRVAHELELPITETKEYKDANGNVTKVTAPKDITATGNYLTSQNKEGDAAWGTRSNWCMMYGRKGGDVISIAIIDHPDNVGYPTYWHARNYGLFAANPLGQKVFSNGKETLEFSTEERPVHHFPLPHRDRFRQGKTKPAGDRAICKFVQMMWGVVSRET